MNCHSGTLKPLDFDFNQSIAIVMLPLKYCRSGTLKPLDLDLNQSIAIVTLALKC